jgi:protocatechuate 3,4-dioxygenase beta subunit
MTTIGKKDLTRRAALEMLGAIGAALTVGCGGSDANGTGGAGGGGGTGGSGTSTTSTSGTTSTSSTSTSSGSTASWATGDGTFLDGKDYGNPFSSGIGSTCKVYKESTQGPCRSNSFHRQELTEGVVGLPTRLELVVVDQNCNPVPDAIVEIWHCSPLGIYSAAKTAEPSSDIGYDSSNFGDLNEQFCTGGDAEGEAKGWFRGYQKAGSDGRVTFDTLFPGWYPSRTIHIHFMITVGSTTYATSQLFFDDSLNDEILADHASYSSNGAKDTTNAADNVAGGLTLSEVVMSYQKQSDGALLAWKAITINA